MITKKSLMALAGAGMLALAGCDAEQTTSASGMDLTKPEAVAEAAMRALIKGDADTWIALFRDGQKSAEAESFVKKGAEDAKENGVEFVSARVDTCTGDKASVSVITKNKDGWEGKKMMRLVKVGDEWRLE